MHFARRSCGEVTVKVLISCNFTISSPARASRRALLRRGYSIEEACGATICGPRLALGMAISHRPGHAVEVSIDEAKEGYIA